MALMINITRPYFIRSRSSGKFLDVPAASKAGGTVIRQYTYNGGVNQRWYITPIPYVNLNQFTSTPVQVTSYDFEILPYFNRKFALDVPGGSTSKGTSIIQWPEHGGFNRRWRLIPVTTAGHIKIYSVHSRLVLDIPAFSTNEGTNVVQWDDNGGQNQHWTLHEAPGDSIVTTTTTTTPNNVLQGLLGHWWSQFYKTTVTVSRYEGGYKVSWAIGGEGSFTQEGNTLWVRWPLNKPMTGAHIATLDRVSTTRIEWSNPPPKGGYHDLWTKL